MSNRFTPSRLDANQVLQSAFDDNNQRLRVDSEATVVNADIDISLDAADDSVSIADQQTGNKLKINSDGSVPVALVSPNGMATETKQDVANVYLGNINQTVGNIFNPFSPPKDCDSVSIDNISTTVDIIYFKKNGLEGITLKTLKITYIDSTKKQVKFLELL